MLFNLLKQVFLLTRLIAAAQVYCFNFYADRSAEQVLQDTVFKEISDYLKCQPEDISLDTCLDELGIDSLGAITIMYELEDRLDVEIPNEVFDSLKIVNDIVNQLEQLLDNKNP